MSFRHYAIVIGVVLLATILAAGSAMAFEANQTPEAYEKVPQSLQNIESSTENISHLTAGGHWTQISGDVAAISHLWSRYKQMGPNDGVSQDIQQSFKAALSRLQRVSAAKQAHRTIQAAHDLRAIAADISDYYLTLFPSGIARLDVLERQLMLDAGAGHLKAAAGAFAKTRYILDSLKPSIEARNGAALMRRFEADLVEQSRALQTKNKAALTAHTKNTLALVSRLEGLYS